MAKSALFGGTTSYIADIVIQNSSSSTGAGLTGLVFNSSGLAAAYKRKGDSSWTAITLVTAATGTYTSGGFVQGDATKAAGAYEFGVPNACLASGVPSVIIHLYGGTNMIDVWLEFQIDAVNYQSPTGFVASVPAVAGAVGSVTGAVGSVTGAVGSVSGSVGSVSGAVGSVTNPASIAASILLTPSNKLGVDVNNEVTANNVGGGGTVAANITQVNGNTFTGANVPASVAAYASGQDPVTKLYADAGFTALIANTNGAYVFTPPSAFPGTGTLVLKDKTNTTTLLTITLNFDTNKNVTARTVA